MKHYILLLAAALLLWNFQCGKDDPEFSGVSFEVGKPFEVQTGITYTENGGPLSLNFNEIISDSRCAKDAICAWEGSTEAAFFLKTGTNTQTDTLSSNHYGGWSDSTLFQGYKIKLVGVEPENMVGVEIPQADYRLKLLVTK